MAEAIDMRGAICPVPLTKYERILLGHGSGGKLSADLLASVFLPAFANPVLCGLEDQATLPIGSDTDHAPRIAFTTDSYVVRPRFFPGGDIGSLAVHGTINDLAVGGARPMFLSAAFILEEGLPLEELERVVASIRAACAHAGVDIVAGDTKVVERGSCDGLFITTAGIGLVPHGRRLSIRSARTGDKIILSGTIGDHGIAIMSVREGIEFETQLESDTAPLTELTELMLAASPDIRAMRDATRGGLASALNELAEASKVGVTIDEAAIPLRDEVHAACEMLGLEPLHIANEGKLIAVVPADDADKVLAAMHTHPLGNRASIIGEVTAEHPGMVVERTLIGGQRVVMMLSGEQLPRIC